MIHISLHPGGHQIVCRPGTLIIEAAARAGLVVNTPCGGVGKCGKCRVRFEGDAPEPNSTERVRLSDTEIVQGWRLACQTRVEKDAEIMVPPDSLFTGQHQIQVSSDRDAIVRATDNAVRRYVVKMAKPTLQDDVPDLLRVERALADQLDGAPLEAPQALLQRLGTTLRDSRFEGTAVLRGNTLMDFESGAATARACALAFDIGTTTLVAALLDSHTGEELAVVSAMNPQTAYGDDVLSRIAVAGRDAPAAAEMQRVLVEALRDMVARLCKQAEVSPTHVYDAAFAGNTTMEHLLCGCNPQALGVVPFVPLFGRGLNIDAAALGLGLHPGGRSYIFPVIGGFVGGDTVAGLLATGLLELEGPALMVDIGTNGEIVLAHDGKLWAASTAAGPAFEGARISCGMRAAEGAIERVRLNSDIEFDVIGNARPVGLCGSGLIDLCGELLKADILSAHGRLKRKEELHGPLAATIGPRLRCDERDEPEFVLAESALARVTLTQRDVRELQLGAGAIRAGIGILLKQAGLSPKDLQQVLIAGGFGSFIRRDNAQRIGLIPHTLPHDRIRFVGNVAFSGAKWAVLSQRDRDRAEQLARMTQHVDLSQDEDFAMEFAMAMHFPTVESSTKG